ncbi:glycosyltransferase family 2 protein [Termitidicoccus mucosus]|uniref:Glycosyltransferase 2-like domain-containing protein n=1 Tax=Termitidicoccus mucosus TaxID=1184151 RepID=A0A178IDQ7_9BACT|nr:hypothetical protein AW736_20235 [Opitutaceae bacterium TSB47]
MLFSVIIPSYNRLELLKEALDSVWWQTFTDYEVIVVDDGSSDGTWEYLLSQGERLTALRQANAGPGPARNLGAKHAKGEYLAFLDSDDLWFPWTLATYHSVIKENGLPSFIAGKPFRFDHADQLARVESEQLEVLNFRDYYESGDEWRWHGVSSFVIRRNVFQGSGGFPNDFFNGEDADLAMRLGVSPGFIQIVRRCSFGYRNHGGNITKDVINGLSGINRNLTHEQTGVYPGGSMRAKERSRILTRQVRSASLEYLHARLISEAWHLYRQTFFWHVRLGRWKYLLGFPVKALLS